MNRPATPVRTTLLALVQTLSNEGRSELAVERQVLEILGKGQVVLIGNFRGVPLCGSHSIDSTGDLGSAVNRQKENRNERA